MKGQSFITAMCFIGALVILEPSSGKERNIFEKLLNMMAPKLACSHSQQQKTGKEIFPR